MQGAICGVDFGKVRVEKKGSTNRFSIELMERAKAEGDLPVDFLLKLMRDETLDTRTRLYAAKAAAPYVHHKLSAMKLEASTDLTHEEFRSLV